MSNFTSEELRTAAKVARAAGFANTAVDWEKRADTVAKSNLETAYIEELVEVYYHGVGTRVNQMRAVLDRLEQDGWTRP